jgi:hypothetical protein
MMQKYQKVPKISYCNVCKLVGHDEKDCRTMDLLRERTSDAYKVQVEMMTGKATPLFNQVLAPYNIAQQHYNNAQKPYNISQPHYNTTQYNHCLSITHCKVIELATEAEEEQEDNLEEVED